MYKNIKNNNTNRTLSFVLILKSCKLNPNKIAPRKKGKNCIRAALDGLILIPMQETPNIRAIFEILEPTTVPMANSSLLLITDEIPTKISGAEVPSATIVKPMVNSLMPSFFARSDELSTNLSAPQTKTAIEVRRPTR